MKKILEDLDAADAFRRPAGEGKAPWEIVHHVTAWIRELIRRLDGRYAPEPVEGNWAPLPEPTAENWQHTRAALASALEDLEEALDAFPEERLSRDVGADGGEEVGITYYAMVHGLLHHNVYHSAEIRLLRKTSQ
jgi:hypothetical protein